MTTPSPITPLTKAGRIAAYGGNRALVNRAELHRPGPLGFDRFRKGETQ